MDKYKDRPPKVIKDDLSLKDLIDNNLKLSLAYFISDLLKIFALIFGLSIILYSSEDGLLMLFFDSITLTLFFSPFILGLGLMDIRVKEYLYQGGSYKQATKVWLLTILISIAAYGILVYPLTFILPGMMSELYYDILYVFLASVSAIPAIIGSLLFFLMLMLKHLEVYIILMVTGILYALAAHFFGFPLLLPF